MNWFQSESGSGLTDVQGPGHCQTSTESLYTPFQKAQDGFCESCHPTYPRESQKVSPNTSLYIPCKVSGTHLHGLECSTSIFQSLQTLRRKKTDIHLQNQGEPKVLPLTPAVLHGHRPESDSMPLLQVCPALHASVFPFRVRGLVLCSTPLKHLCLP